MSFVVSEQRASGRVNSFRAWQFSRLFPPGNILTQKDALKYTGVQRGMKV